ncbi:MAG: dihydrolipoamide acetyltransferase family protein [Acidimicrobiia bacterium]
MSVTITMPQLGETVTEGTILSWVKEVGEFVAEDDILVEISTDKVDTEIPSPAEGVLTEILIPAGTTVNVGTAICVLSGDREELSDVSPQPSAAEPAELAVESESVVGGAGRERRGVLSPVVRKLAAEHGIDLAMVPGTGDGGRITRRDVEAFLTTVPPSGGASELASEGPMDRRRRVREPGVAGEPEPTIPPETPASTGDEDVREIGRLRKLIAENMVNARRSAAHAWTSVEVDYERIESVRTANKAAFKEAEGFSLTYLPFIARATMEALSAFPAVNSRFDLEAGTHTFHRQVNLGLAIDLAQKGLIVANIPAADSMTLRAIARAVRATADAAHDKKLGPDDLTGYTFSITNPGPFGSFMSAPIIPPSNAAILSTETITKRPVVVELPDGSDGIAIHHIGYLGLSWDHRVFDGSTAVLFLNRIKENLETWDWRQELK